MNGLPRSVARELAAGIVLFLAFTAGAAQADFSGVVVAVLDGDTVEVLVDRRPVRVRLANIDAPERKQPFGTKSRQALASVVFRQGVLVKTAGSDRSGRTIGTLFVGERNVNRDQVAAGMAWVYRQYLRDDDALLAIELKARSARKGLWADPQPIAPWAWRRRR